MSKTASKGSFSVMGTSVPQSVMNVSKGNSKYTTSVPKKTMGRGSSPTGTTGKRGAVKINEANGPKCHIVSTLYKRNAAAASETQRNVRVMPSAIGNRDFWSKRQYGQGV